MTTTYTVSAYRTDYDPSSANAFDPASGLERVDITITYPDDDTTFSYALTGTTDLIPIVTLDPVPLVFSAGSVDFKAGLNDGSTGVQIGRVDWAGGATVVMNIFDEVSATQGNNYLIELGGVALPAFANVDEYNDFVTANLGGFAPATDAFGPRAPIPLADIPGIIAFDDPDGDSIPGTNGDDLLEGGVGEDTLDGMAGDDTLLGGEGDDLLLGGDGDDDLFDGQGSDIVEGGAGDDTMRSGAGADAFDGGAGNDTFIWDISSATGSLSLVGDLERGVSGFLDNASLTDVLANIENYEFRARSSYQIELIGTDGANRLSAGDGDDTITGGGGNDTIDGGAGEDLALFETVDSGTLRVTVLSGGELVIDSALGQDVVTGIEQFRFSDGTLSLNDLLSLGSAAPIELTGTDRSELLEGDTGNDRIFGLGGNDTILGSDGADTLNGGDGDDSIEGGASRIDLRDVVYAGNGDDRVDAGYGNDEVYGQGGNDTLAGGFGVDQLYGQDGDDVITGSAFSDLVFGGDGDDFVNGGFGFDRINGGSGADRFFHIGVEGHGSDWIQDYTADEGDVLFFGQPNFSADQFRVNFAHTETPEGERSGNDDVEEAFVIFSPTGQILWALVDGAGQDQINLQISGLSDVFDLLA